MLLFTQFNAVWVAAISRQSRCITSDVTNGDRSANRPPGKLN